MSKTRIDPLSWLLSSRRLGEVGSNLSNWTSTNSLLLCNQDKGSTRSRVHLHDPGLPKVSTTARYMQKLVRYVLLVDENIQSKTAMQVKLNCCLFCVALCITKNTFLSNTTGKSMVQNVASITRLVL